MKQTIEGVKRFAERTKLVTALLALFLSGALIASGLVAWRYDLAIRDLRQERNDTVGQLQSSLNTERNITRRQLNSQAESLAQITADVKQMWPLLEQAAKTASSAASTAKNASETAKGAATTAARAAIRETVVPVVPIVPEKKPKDNAEWLGGG